MRWNGSGVDTRVLTDKPVVETRRGEALVLLLLPL
jgi:hypothetical protein